MNTSPTQLGMTIRQALGIDLYAAALSLLCLLHCLALPLMASILPVAGHLSENELIHQVLVTLAAPVTLWAVWTSLPKAASAWPFIASATFGLALLLLAGFVHAVAAYESWLTIVGALCLGLAHLWRWSQHVKRRHSHDSETADTNISHCSPH